MKSLRLPEFIIAGAPRSGTQWLHAVADRHPEIEMAKPLVPEPKFFLRDDLYERGLAYYSQTWFESIPAGKMAGEKSTNYLESETAARRIAQTLPDVRLVFVLRNPVERAYSNYLWSRQNGLETEDFETALALEEERERTAPESHKYSRPHALFSRGLYARNLRPYLERFPREQILVIRSEDIAVAPGDVAESLHRFLGVAIRRQDAEGQERINAAKNDEGLRMNDQTRKSLAARYAAANAELYTVLGPGFGVWSDLAEDEGRQ